MVLKVGINGFGRIGRNFFRIVADNHDIQVVAVNDLTNGPTLAHLLKYDSIHGQFNAMIESNEDIMCVNGREIKVFAEKDPGKIPWRDAGVDVVVEATGRFTDYENAKRHLDAGARKVVITAPATMPNDATIIIGVNQNWYDPAKNDIISCGSCTTNCLAPMVKVIHENIGVVRGSMTTVHSYTNDQNLLDLPHRDLRRARAAAMSMIPTSTGATKLISLIFPELKGKISGLAVRVPTPNVSLTDLVLEVSRPTTKEEVNSLFKDAALGELRGIVDYCDEPLVSRDFYGNPHSCIFDALSTMVIDGTLVKTLAWYDNEWGYSNRVADLILFMALCERLAPK
ncbi:MAG: type I glyceraldehyde-3-phosphate dehydrogenase [Bacillota bacterium]